MLILDEFHTLLAGTAKQRQNALAELKMISNKIKIPIVGAGTKDVIVGLKGKKYNSNINIIDGMLANIRNIYHIGKLQELLIIC